jgi:hypothetical protein
MSYAFEIEDFATDFKFNLGTAKNQMICKDLAIHLTKLNPQ